MKKMIALVTVMSLMIVVGLGFVAYGIIKGAGELKPFDQTLALPPGAAVKSMAGDRDELALHVTSPEGDYITFIDPSSGRTRGTLRITTTAKP
jgi:hypothetical protein